MQWREQVSELAQTDVDGLFASSLEIAGESIADSGGFNPFLLVLDETGERAIRHLHSAGSLGEDEIFRALAGDDDTSALRAYALAVDVTLKPSDEDGVKVQIEHREGVVIELVVPYVVGPEAINMMVESASAAVGRVRLWDAGPDAQTP